MARLRAAILMGGDSAEREVSLASGQTVLDVLDKNRYDSFVVDPGESGWMERLLEAPRVDVAILCLHGPGGEDGVLQGFLESAGIPFTGSGVLSSALCMDKELAKTVLEASRIPVPQSLVVTAADRERMGLPEIANALPLPLVVKPNRQGSTCGVTLVRERSDLPPAIDTALQLDTRALVEEYIAGTEITVCVLGGDEPETLPIVEIIPQSGFYDYHDKYTPGATEEIIPARISAAMAAKARDYALAAHRLLKCWGVSRTDMIVAADQVWVLEVNTIPGMTGTSLLPQAAAASGLSMAQVVDRLVELALARRRGD